MGTPKVNHPSCYYLNVLLSISLRALLLVESGEERGGERRDNQDDVNRLFFAAV